jgi:hypothetical protein
MKKVILLFVALLIVSCLSAYADNFPKLINYQGMLTQSDGKTPVTDGQYHLTFKIYGSSSGVDSLWTEHHQTVQVTNGLFNVLLGSVTPLDLPFDAPYWLGIKVGDDSELSPRIQLTSVGYAFRAQKADTASVAVSAGSGWIDDGQVVRLETSTDKVCIGTTRPDGGLHIHNESGQGAVVISGVSDNGQTYSALYFKDDSLAGRNQWVLGYKKRIGCSEQRALHFVWDGGGGDVVLTLQPSGNVGIGTTDPRAKLDVREAADNGGTLLAARLGNAYNHWTYFGDGNSGRIRGSGEGYLYLSSNPDGTGDKRIYLNAS